MGRRREMCHCRDGGHASSVRGWLSGRADKLLRAHPPPPGAESHRSKVLRATGMGDDEKSDSRTNPRPKVRAKGTWPALEPGVMREVTRMKDPLLRQWRQRGLRGGLEGPSDQTGFQRAAIESPSQMQMRLPSRAAPAPLPNQRTHRSPKAQGGWCSRRGGSANGRRRNGDPCRGRRA